MEKNTRIIQIDNIKCILIFLVVLGHLCEQIPFENNKFLYLLIYSFHMPAFAFLSGYCCKKMTGEKLIIKYYYPYIVFQTCYIVFAKYLLHETIKLQYSTPYWILWYLLAMFMWNVTISLFSDSEKILMKLLIIGSIAALLVGYENTISYYLSLSRIIVIFPFFVGGYYIRGKKYRIFKSENSKINIFYKLLTLLCVILVTFILYLNQNKIQTSWAYHSQPYQVLQYNILYRIFFFITSIIFIIFLCIFIPNKKIKIITEVGQNTIGIFLIHGVIIRYLAYKSILQTLPFPQLCIILLSTTILLVCSNKYMRILIRPLVEFPIR